MECIGKLKDVSIDFESGAYNVTFTVSKNVREQIDDIKDKQLSIKAVQFREKRSLDANAYLWVLCDKIADKLGSTKEEVYQDAIKEVGTFQLMLLKDEAVEDAIRLWNKAGLGSFAEFGYKSKQNPGCSAVVFYFGSSSYNTKEMSKLIDYIIGEAKTVGVDTRTPEEIRMMKERWGV